MKLYYSPGACSLSTHIALEELGFDAKAISLEKVDLKTHQYNGTDFYKINKKGSVPALQLQNGEILTEAAVILQYLADQKPEIKLIPAAGTLERYRCEEWLNFIATELHKGFVPILKKTFDENAKIAAKEILFKKFDLVNEHLSKNQYLMGDRFTVADGYLFTVLRWTKMGEIDMSKWPMISAFSERVGQRPKVQSVLKQEGLA